MSSRDRRARPRQALRFTHGGQPPQPRPGRGPHLRLPRSQRRRQDDDFADDLRPAHARQRRRHLLRLRPGARARSDQAQHRLHDPAFRPLRRAHHPREPRLRGPRPRARPPARAGRPRARAAGPSAAAEAARRRPVGRLEAATVACRRGAARAQTAAARRAHRRRRPQGAPNLLGPDCTPTPRKASRYWFRPITWTRPSAVTRSPISPMAS